jgi:hypothetical protein
MQPFGDLQKANGYLEKRKRYSEFQNTKEMCSKIDLEIQAMIRDRVIVETLYKDLKWINTIYLVPRPHSDKVRLVVDMRKINQLGVKRHFRMEGIPMLKDLIAKKDYSISFDLKDAYNHIPVYPSLQPYLGICWKSKTYRYLGMPFGLMDAPRVFSQIMKKCVKTIRELWNIKATIYLDDFILHQDCDHLEIISERSKESIEAFIAVQLSGMVMELKLNGSKNDRRKEIKGIKVVTRVV